MSMKTLELIAALEAQIIAYQCELDASIAHSRRVLGASEIFVRIAVLRGTLDGLKARLVSFYDSRLAR